MVLNEFKGNQDLPLGDEWISTLGFNSLDEFQCGWFLAILILLTCMVNLLAVKYANNEKR